MRIEIASYLDKCASFYCKKTRYSKAHMFIASVGVIVHSNEKKLKNLFRLVYNLSSSKTPEMVRRR